MDNAFQAAKRIANNHVKYEHMNKKQKAAQFGGKSNEIEVRDGDTVEITTTKWSYIFFWLIIVYSVFATFAETPIYQTIIHVSFLVLYLVILFLLDSYRLEILETKSKRRHTNF